MGSTTMASKGVDELFRVKSGDFHATKELDSGQTPLVSCGERSHGVVGYFDIPPENRYRDCLTVAYNGQPLLAKFHPYAFGAKDDVAILIPRSAMRHTTLLYVAAMLNRLRWRYGYNRKCFREKLRGLQLPVPVIPIGGEVTVDEDAIAKFFPRTARSFVPQKQKGGTLPPPPFKWQKFNVSSLLKIRRGDFHAISQLSNGRFMTISRVTEDNGVVGFFERPDNAKVYKAGHLTVSTLGGDAFVQLEDFIATDNVLVCSPRESLCTTTVFFICLMLNRSKWRYSYGRQCYRTKFSQMELLLPVTDEGVLDDQYMKTIVENTSHWPLLQPRFR